MFDGESRTENIKLRLFRRGGPLEPDAPFGKNTLGIAGEKTKPGVEKCLSGGICQCDQKAKTNENEMCVLFGGTGRG